MNDFGLDFSNLLWILHIFWTVLVKSLYRSISFWIKSRKRPCAPPAPCRVFSVFRRVQPDTLNPTKVQSFTSPHVAPTWRELKQIRKKKNKGRLSTRRLWVMYWIVLCLMEPARQLIFPSDLCTVGLRVFTRLIWSTFHWELVSSATSA